MEVMNLAEAARFIRVSDKTLGEMVRTKRIPGQKVGREWRFSREALRHWLSATPAERAVSSPPAETQVAEPQVQYAIPYAGFKDTAFAENRDRTLHRWVPWIAGYSAAFVDDVLATAAAGRTGLTVLDPFSGVGTTLIEALKHGHHAVGFEINPYAALACRTKVNAAFYDVALFDEKINQFESFAADKARAAAGTPKARPPFGFTSRVPFFSPTIERQVLHVFDFIQQLTTDWMRDLFRVAFGSVMVSFSNYSYEPSLGTREGAGKANIEHADVAAILCRKLREMAEDIETFQGWMAAFDSPPRAIVHTESFFDGCHRVAPGSVDIMVTSPPYLNNYHYVRNTRPHLFWLGMTETPADLKEMERKSFGQFWQTVRSGPTVALLPKIAGLREQIEDLKKRNAEKGAYGGEGWANYAASYFNDCDQFCASLLGLMRPGGTAVVVIGNNILQGIEFPTDRYFAEIAREKGFEIVELHEVRKKRTGNSIVNSSVRSGTVKQRARLYETAIEMRAPAQSGGR